MSRYYACFFEGDRQGMGSDSVFILDGRNRLSAMIEDARERMQIMKRLKKYNRFQIISSGSRLFENERILFDSRNIMGEHNA